VTEFIILFISGISVGILGPLLGIGGGSIIIPILTLYFKIPIHTAIATGLVTIIASSTSAVPENISKKLVNIKLGLTLETITATCAIAGSMLTMSLNEKTISIIFAIILFITSISYLTNSKKDDAKELIKKYDKESLKGTFDGYYFDERLETFIYYKVVKVYWTLLISGIAGLMSGMLGIGGGIFKVPAMNMISKIPIKVATATSNFMVGLTAAAGSIVFFVSGYVDVRICSIMILGVVLGSKVIAKKFKKISDTRLKKVFVIFLLFIAVQMLFKGLK
jgi:uncharacterized membrane protein YfcA